MQTNDTLTSLQAGMTPERSKIKTVTFTAPVINSIEFINAYRGDWAVQKLIDTRINDAFRKWRGWRASAEEITLLEATESRIDIKNKLKYATTIADVTGQSYVYIDTNDSVDRAEPIDINTAKKGAIRFITVLQFGQLTEGPPEQDAMSPNFGLPKWYEINSNTSGNVLVHPSRILTFYGKERVSHLHVGAQRGDSLILAAMGALKQYTGTILNVADLVYEAKIDVLSVAGLMEMLKSTKSTKVVEDRYTTLARMKSNNGMIVLEKDTETYEQKKMSFATLPDIIKATEQQLAGAGEYPHSIFFGASTGGLGSTGNLELSTYYDTVNQYQVNKLTRPMSRIMDDLVIIDALGSRVPEVHYEWLPLWQMSDKERAEIGKMQSETIKNMSDLYPDEVLAPTLVNMATESGTMVGLETAYKDWIDSGGELTANEGSSESGLSMKP